MENKYSGAITLGYASLFVSLWLFFIPFTGWIGSESGEALLPILLVLGGVVLAIAGIFCLSGEARIESVLFLVLAAVIFSFSIRFIMFPNLSANTNPSVIDGWILILISAAIFYLWLASFKGGAVKQFLLLALWLSFLAGAIANWFASSIFGDIAAYIGLIASLLSGWYFASTILTKKQNNPA